ncbi:flagellar biosynthetic protein FliP [Candidatus Kryptobacter tengchongensis]|uniref:Flagellar biosynthetic protein FliP n=1 Tax=Kryptobacter tengchongensis TaxID=1643429 RepID=A0A656D0Q2_KRYT1|nr:flagellar type III secretion system pore protein FliP [Candidatus Kryptobacter tengchongensis]CUS96214.1 flagellar biosynthetic protein FliP [Candidatus Kryptobacter tengchongensis]CUU04077.1 flagellar biosynthetic protein FliP [Candidatus Kryptobacter tengchongensis]
MRKFVLLLIFVLSFSIANAQTNSAEKITFPVPKITVEVGKAQKSEDVAVTLQILFLMTILSLAPAIIILTTSFTRIIVVFHFLKQALGVQQMPPSQVLVGLALFLTFFIMSPVWDRINKDAIQPYLKNEINQEEAYNRAIKPIREFMFKQVREDDLALFVSLSNLPKPNNKDEIPTHVLIPAFAISELKIAFQIGFLIYIPFLMIDLIVASVLMSMGMIMLPPVMISLPFKILLFILIDGWHLVVQSLIQSFR